MMRGTPYLSPWRQTVSVCGSTPWFESRTHTAPSSTRSERSTSIVKSTWPGVSMIFSRRMRPSRPGQKQVDHGVLVARPRSRDQPANSERLAALRTHLDRHLIGGTTDTPRPHLDRRHDVVERLVEELHGIGLGLRLHALEGAVNDALSG